MLVCQGHMALTWKCSSDAQGHARRAAIPALVFILTFNQIFNPRIPSYAGMFPNNSTLTPINEQQNYGNINKCQSGSESN